MRRPHHSRLLSFAVAVVACGLAALVGTLLPPPYLYTPFPTAYVAVLISALFGGRAAGLFAVIATLQEEIARRRRMTEELRRSEDSYRTLADNFPSGAVLMFDTDLRLRMAYGVELNEVGLPRERTTRVGP